MSGVPSTGAAGGEVDWGAVRPDGTFAPRTHGNAVTVRDARGVDVCVSAANLHSFTHAQDFPTPPSPSYSLAGAHATTSLAIASGSVRRTAQLAVCSTLQRNVGGIGVCGFAACVASAKLAFSFSKALPGGGREWGVPPDGPRAAEECLDPVVFVTLPQGTAPDDPRVLEFFQALHDSIIARLKFAGSMERPLLIQAPARDVRDCVESVIWALTSPVAQPPAPSAQQPAAPRPSAVPWWRRLLH
jgi:hypothetical protein